MKKSLARSVLYSGVSVLASAIGALVLPSSASAQTICTGTPTATQTDITCVNGATVVATGTTELTTVVVVAGQGLDLLSGANQTTTLVPGGAGADTIRTTSEPGILAMSGGSLTLNAPDVNVVTTGGALPAAVNLRAALGVTAQLGDITTTAVNSTALFVDSFGAITITTGDLSAGFASSDAVAIPDFGFAIGQVDLTTGNITTAGIDADRRHHVHG